MPNSLEILNSEAKPAETRSFKRMTCLVKEEEVLIPPQINTPITKKRYCYRFGTMKNDMGFGAQTGDMIESLVVYSMEPNRFETGKQYNIKVESI